MDSSFFAKFTSIIIERNKEENEMKNINKSISRYEKTVSRWEYICNNKYGRTDREKRIEEELQFMKSQMEFKAEA